MKRDNAKFKVEFKKRLFSMTLKLIDFLDHIPKDLSSRRIADQLMRSGTSIISNYVEGLSASSRRDFTNYLTISLKSCNESKLWLCILRDSQKVNSTEVNWFIKELNEISKILASSIITLKGKRIL